MSMRFDFALKIKALIDNKIAVYKIVNDFESWSLKKQKQFIDESFHHTIDYCFNNIEYYKKLLIERDLSPNDFTSVEDILKLPTLSKDDIRNNYLELRPSFLRDLNYTSRRSGGTTGEPIESLVCRTASSYETFSYFKGLRWMGWDPSITIVKLMGGSLGISNPSFRNKVYSFAMGSINIPAFDLNQQNIEFYYKKINSQNKICFLGYASAVNNLVDLLKQKNLHLNNVKLAITTSEQLIEDWKINIESYLNCKVRSYYGFGEILSLGYQQVNDNAYKIPAENVYIESEKNTNEIIVTQLHNRAQPLLRYKPGDIAVLDNNLYSKKIISLEGRTADYFFKKNGEKISPIFGTYSIQKSLIKVKKYQYVQNPDLSIEFRYVMENDSVLTDKNKQIINKIVSDIMLENTNVIFCENKDFEISSSRKHRITVKL